PNPCSSKLLQGSRFAKRSPSRKLSGPCQKRFDYIGHTVEASKPACQMFGFILAGKKSLRQIACQITVPHQCRGQPWIFAKPLIIDDLFRPFLTLSTGD